LNLPAKNTGMKKIVLFLLTLSPYLVYSQKDTTFTINGKLKNSKDTVQWVYLSYLANNVNISDSVIAKANTYSFTGKFTDPVKATLMATYQSSDSYLMNTVPKRDMITFFLETGNIIITSIDSFANATIKAGKANTEFAKLERLLKPYDDKIQNLEDQYDLAEKTSDSANSKKIKAKIETELDAIDSIKRVDVYGQYARKNITSPIALYALQIYGRYDFKNVDKVDPLFNQLPEAAKNSNAGKIFKERIEIAKKLRPGMTAMDFSQTDTSGNSVSLSSLRGKYVLLNFWASWCPHCRKDNPYLVSIFNKYKDKPFTILSVSVDKPGQKEKWLQAIHDDHLTWTHVSDLQLWNNAVAKQYGVTGIPQNFLIDPSGKIVARNLMAEKLDNKLAEIFVQK
jgi:peroxiredoxin